MIYLNQEWYKTNKVTLTICCVIWMVKRFLKLGNVSFVQKKDLKNIINIDDVFIIGFEDEDTVKRVGSSVYLLEVLTYLQYKGVVNNYEYKVLRILGRYLATDEITLNVGKHCCEEGNDDLVDCINMTGLSFIYRSFINYNTFTISSLHYMEKLLNCMFEQKLKQIENFEN